MRIKVDLKGNSCQFEQCVNYYEGICLNDQARKDCLDIALAVLCVNKEVANEKRLQERIQADDSQT